MSWRVCAWEQHDLTYFKTYVGDKCERESEVDAAPRALV